MAGERIAGGVEATLRELLSAIYLRLLCGRFPLTEKERALVLERHEEALQRDLAQIMVAVSHAQNEAIQAMRFRIHHAEGIDHEMVDQALAYAPASPEREGSSE